MSTCKMTEHGSLTASASCCHPDSPDFMGVVKPSAPVGSPVQVPESFWTDTEVWKSAGGNTLNCLVGCSIGDFGMMFYLTTYHPGLAVPVVMAFAMASGLITSIGLETVLLRVREQFTWHNALRTAFSMSIISMLGMEFAATATDFALTGGTVALNTAWFWVALAISLLVGFLAPLPYNYYKLKKHGQACH